VGKVLALLFIVVPFVEIYLLITVGSYIGVWPTLAFVIGTGILGAWLAKREGLRVMKQYSEALARGEMPKEGVLSGLLVLVGAVLLMMPGVLTDILGLFLLFPLTRKLAAVPLSRWARSKVSQGAIQVHSVGLGDFASFEPPPPGRGDVIDIDP
jgi:UPF0716 protein FxsA